MTLVAKLARSLRRLRSEPTNCLIERQNKKNVICPRTKCASGAVKDLF